MAEEEIESMEPTQTEGYFERLHREAAPLREATEPFTKQFMSKLKLLDLSEGGHTDCAEVADCPEITICYLHTNAIRVLEHADACARACACPRVLARKNCTRLCACAKRAQEFGARL